jgi:hypothetical protein
MRVILSHVPRWWPLAVLAVPALGYTLFRSDQLQYWDGAVGNLVATLLGIIAGVPVALHLERRRAANDAEEKRSEEIRIKREILTLLREELENNLSRFGLVAYLCRSDYSFRLLGVRRPGGFYLPKLNAFGAGYRSR